MSARHLSQYFLSLGVVTTLTSIPVRGSGGPGWWWRGVWPSSPPPYTTTWLALRRSEITMSWCPRCNDSVQVQQELARPGRLERFLTDEDKIRQVRRLFTGLYSLDQVIIHTRMSDLCWLDCCVRMLMVTPMSGWLSPVLRGLCWSPRGKVAATTCTGRRSGPCWRGCSTAGRGQPTSWWTGYSH